MSPAPTVSVIEDRAAPGGGYAVIRVAGVTTNPGDAGFAIRRQGYQKNNLGYSGWQGPEVRLQPIDVAFTPGQLDLMIGPEVVDVIEVGTPVELEIPSLGLRTFLHWPDIPPSVRAHQGAARGRVGFATRPPPPVAGPSGPPPAPPPAGPEPADEATMLGGAADQPTVLGSGWDDDDTDQTVIGPPPPLRHAGSFDDEGTLASLAPPRDDEYEGGDFLGHGGYADDRYGGYPEEDHEDDRYDDDDFGREDRDHDKPPRRRSGVWLVAGLLLLLLIAGGIGASIVFYPELWPDGWFVAREEEEPDPEPAPQPEPPTGGETPPDPEPPTEVVETPPPDREPPREPPPGPVELVERDALRRPTEFVRDMIRSDPTPQETYEMAQFYLERGDADVALLLLERGDERGHGPSIGAIGRMYDPVHFSPRDSAFTRANPDRAIEYYRRARDAGDPDALRALNDLRDWLEGQAADGDPEAERILGQYW